MNALWLMLISVELGRRLAQPEVILNIAAFHEHALVDADQRVQVRCSLEARTLEKSLPMM
jgi:hypothetical protein